MKCATPEKTRWGSAMGSGARSGAEPRSRPELRGLVTRLALALLLLGGSLPASPVQGDEALQASPPPFPLEDPRVRELWERAQRLEHERELAASIPVWEELAATLPDEPHPCWRIARSHVRIAGARPVADEAARIADYREAQRWAALGAERDPDCAECRLYEFIGLSMATRLQGTLAAARSASRMSELLERAFELGPTWVDDAYNVELANLRFAAGVFYQVLPDSRLVRFAIGARGDRELARRHFREALAICDQRIDYHVALGAILLCDGRQSGDTPLAAEGLALLERALELEDYLATDAIDRDHARILVAEPERACDYSRERWRRAEGR